MFEEFMGNGMQGLISTISWAKLAYTAILALLLVLIVSELYRLWLSKEIYVAEFEMIGNDSRSDKSGANFTATMLEFHAQLRKRFSEEETETEEALGTSEPGRNWTPHRRFDKTWTPKASSAIRNSTATLSDLEITFQDINITDILARLRRYISPRIEISGRVHKSGNLYNVRVRAGSSAGQSKTGRTIAPVMHIEALDDLREAAFHVACGLIWREAARDQKELSIVGREEFCQWVAIWLEYHTLRTKFERQGRLTEPQVKTNGELRSRLTRLIDAGIIYPLFYRLRADLIDLLPVKEREKPELIQQTQADLVRYAVLLKTDPDNRRTRIDPLDTPEAYSVLAEARPAIIIPDTGFDERAVPDASSGWRPLLAKAKIHLDAVARATGLVTVGDKTSPELFLAAFAVAPGVLASVGFAGPSGKGNGNGDGPALMDWDDASFSFAGSGNTEGNGGAHRVSRVFIPDQRDTTGLMLLEIDGHDVEANPPLRIPDTFAATGGAPGPRQRIAGHRQPIRGDFVAVVSYPFRGGGLFPAPFLDALLPGKIGVKRIMPGRILRTPATKDAESSLLGRIDEYITDVSTTAGTAGGPLIDLRTGDLLGIHFGGAWQNTREGKFAYSRSVQSLFAGIAPEKIFAGQAETRIADYLAQQKARRPNPDETKAAAVDERPGRPIVGNGYQADFLPGLKLPVPSAKAEPALSTAYPDDGVLKYIHHSILMNRERRMALYAIQNVDGASLKQIVRSRAIVFEIDGQLLSDMQIGDYLYKRNVLDRGHLVRPSSVAWGRDEQATQAYKAAFLYPNITPQHKNFNRRTWVELENFVLDLIAERRAKATIITGPVFGHDDPVYRDIKIPQIFWKIVVLQAENDKPEVAAFALRQKISIQGNTIDAETPDFDQINSRVTVEQVERWTGLDFGPLRRLSQ